MLEDALHVILNDIHTNVKTKSEMSRYIIA